MGECARECDHGGFPALADFFRHFHAYRVVSLKGRPGMQQWIKEWSGISAEGRKLLLPIVMASFQGGPMGRSASRPRDLQTVAWREYLTNPEHPKACLELATHIALQGNDRAFFSAQTAQEIKSQAGDVEAALGFARSISKYLPDEVKAQTEAAQFLATYGSVEEGNEAFRKIEEGLTGWRQREARLAHFRWMCAQGTLDEVIEGLAAKRREEAQEGEGLLQAELALADAYLVKGRDGREGEGLSGQAARLYGEVFEAAEGVEERKAAWVGLSDADPACAIPLARPLIEELVAEYEYVPPRGRRTKANLSEAERFGMWLGGALLDALRELRDAPIAEDKAKIAADLARECAAMFALYLDKHPKLHEFIRIRLVTAYCLAGQYEEAVAAYSRDLETQYRFRYHAKDHLRDLFDTLLLHPKGRAAQTQAGLYFLEHLPVSAGKGERPTSNIEHRTSNTERPTSNEEKIRSEILDIWAELLTRTLRAIHGNTYAAAANREPEPVDPTAVAEFERIVTERMEGEGGKDFAERVRRALERQRFSHPLVVDMVNRIAV